MGQIEFFIENMPPIREGVHRLRKYRRPLKPPLRDIPGTPHVSKDSPPGSRNGSTMSLFFNLLFVGIFKKPVILERCKGFNEIFIDFLYDRIFSRGVQNQDTAFFISLASALISSLLFISVTATSRQFLSSG